ncbi:hypothetical protein K504DRAFT_493870 [Pleomassaria siparia CBS 279.74]|uniref:Uncharacterized protein n=1 Tax=Pleomassaria siparia CBS 279.74 TaxID=1314801 RepID=A0A6G1JZM3_9PLEO|nr:hypothetical protein K504DRAFT_493870 [Pleomassaria siparia CBS 279.74]
MVARPVLEEVTYPLHVVRQAAMIGAASAVPGTILGAFTGTLRTTTPILFSIVSGAQWFAIGSTFCAIRTSLLNQSGLRNWYLLTRGEPLSPRTDLNPTLSDKVRISAISGALTGASLGLLFRGPKNVIPGTIMFTLFGYGGQHAYNFLDKKNSTEIERQEAMRAEGKKDPSWMQRMAKSKWSPMSVLSDEEYKHMLEEKLLGVEASIALVDESLDEWRKKKVEAEKEKEKEKQHEAKNVEP